MAGHMVPLKHYGGESMLEEVIADDNSKNIAIHCRDGVVKMHRVMLGGCSQFLRKILEKDRFHMSSITLPDFDCETMNVFMKFIHTGVVVGISGIIDNLRELAAVFQLGAVTECIPSSVNSVDFVDVDRVDFPDSNNDDFPDANSDDFPDANNDDYPDANSDVSNEEGPSVPRRNASKSVCFSGDKKSKKSTASSSEGPLKRTCRMSTRFRKRVFICDVCSGHYDSKGELQEHLKTHAEFTCRKCEKTFEEELELHRHICRNAEKGKCECECGQTFGNFGALASHKRIHNATSPQKPKKHKPIECTLCSRTFNRKDTLKVHMRTHTGEKPYMCPECGKTFIELGNMRCHQRSHSDVRSYVCECGKAFKRKESYKEHQFVHTGERPHVCDVCGKTFRMRSGYALHMRIHTGYKPYHCQCGMKFYHKSDLERHKQRKDHYGPVLTEDMDSVVTAT